jgi:hypothetical protein
MVLGRFMNRTIPRTLAPVRVYDYAKCFDFQFQNNYMFSEAGIVPDPTSEAP